MEASAVSSIVIRLCSGTVLQRLKYHYQSMILTAFLICPHRSSLFEVIHLLVNFNAR